MGRRMAEGEARARGVCCELAALREVLEAEQEQATRDVEVVGEEFRRLQSRLHSQNATVDELQGKLAASEQERERGKAALEAEREGGAQREAALQREYEYMEACTRVDMDAIKAGCEEEVDSLKSELERSRAELETLKAELEGEREKVLRLNAEGESWQSALEGAETEAAASSTRVAEIENEVERTKEEVKRREEEVTRAQEQLEQVRWKLESMVGAVEEVRRLVSTVEESERTSEAIASEQEEYCIGLCCELEDAQCELSELRARAVKAREEQEYGMEMLSTLETGKLAMEAETRAITEALRSLMDQVETVLVTTEHTLNDCVGKSKVTVAAAVQALDSLAQTRRMLEASRAEGVVLKSRVAELERMVDDGEKLRQELEECNRQNALEKVSTQQHERSLLEQIDELEISYLGGGEQEEKATAQREAAENRTLTEDNRNLQQRIEALVVALDKANRSREGAERGRAEEEEKRLGEEEESERAREESKRLRERVARVESSWMLAVREATGALTREQQARHDSEKRATDAITRREEVLRGALLLAGQVVHELEGLREMLRGVRAGAEDSYSDLVRCASIYVVRSFVMLLGAR
eukprot:3537797-Rhodomonas_salina.1